MTGFALCFSKSAARRSRSLSGTLFAPSTWPLAYSSVGRRSSTSASLRFIICVASSVLTVAPAAPRRMSGQSSIAPDTNAIANRCQLFWTKLRREGPEGCTRRGIIIIQRMHKLVLLRHGESDWNRENRFTGWTDVDLSAQGVEEARAAGRVLKDAGHTFRVAYPSVLKRAIRTLNLALEQLDQLWIPVEKHWRLNERHYGALQGLNKS